MHDDELLAAVPTTPHRIQTFHSPARFPDLGTSDKKKNETHRKCLRDERSGVAKPKPSKMSVKDECSVLALHCWVLVS